MTFRLNSFIAKATGISRRGADSLIEAGRVSLNGKITNSFNTQVNPENDCLEVDGKPISLKSYLYIALHKPQGIIVTCLDEKKRKTVLDLLPKKLRHLRPVGRLDSDSEGLLLLTNDGQLAYKVTHPKSHIEKKYLVSVKGKVNLSDIKLMAAGIKIDGKLTIPAKIRLLSFKNNISTLEFIIKEGRNRQIRKMCAQLGYLIVRLVRTQIGELKLGQMVSGSWRYLNQDELSWLK